MLSGCAATDGLMSSVALPNDRTSAPAPAAAGNASSKLMVTGRQRAYLDALVAAGVHPSGDLMALSIGSYVCQAHDAGQSPQAVWDFVHPLVAGDVQNSRPGAGAPTPGDVDEATRTYISIATQRLC